MYDRHVHVFGLTGGIASGKTTVASLFREWGVPVVDADAVAREVVMKGAPALDDLARAFGPEVLDAAGELDRKALARLAFASPEGRRTLGAITHPRIAARSQEHFATLAARGEPLAAYDAALLVENGLAEAFRPLVVVAAPEALQRARAVARDRDDDSAIAARIAAQMPLAAKVAVADFVIDNDGSLAALAAKARTTLLSVLERLGIDRDRYRIPPE